MKDKSVPPMALWGLIGAVVLAVGFFAYTSFVKGPAVVDPTNVSAERLLDPDPPRGASTRPD